MRIYRLKLTCIQLIIFTISMNAPPAAPTSIGIIPHGIGGMAAGNPVQVMHSQDFKHFDPKRAIKTQHVNDVVQDHYVSLENRKGAAMPNAPKKRMFDKKRYQEDSVSEDGQYDSGWDDDYDSIFEDDQLDYVSEDEHYVVPESVEAMELLQDEAKLGDLLAVKYLIESKNIRPNRLVLYNAIESGNLEVVKYVLNQVDFWPTFELKAAALNGHLEIFKFLIHEPYVYLAAAIESGNLEIVKVFIQEFGLKPTPEMLDVAKSKGNTRIVEYLSENIYQISPRIDSSPQIDDQALILAENINQINEENKKSRGKDGSRKSRFFRNRKDKSSHESNDQFSDSKSRLKFTRSKLKFKDNFHLLEDDYKSVSSSETTQSKSLGSKKLDGWHVSGTSNTGEKDPQKTTPSFLDNNLKNHLPVPSFTSHKAKKTKGGKRNKDDDDQVRLLNPQSSSDYHHVENKKSTHSISRKLFGKKPRTPAEEKANLIRDETTAKKGSRFGKLKWKTLSKANKWPKYEDDDHIRLLDRQSSSDNEKEDQDSFKSPTGSIFRKTSGISAERADHSLVENISFKESIRKGASRIRRLRNSRLKLSGSNFGDNFQELNDDYDSLDNSETSQSKSIDSKKLDRLHLLEKSNVGESYRQKAPHAYLENNLKNRLPVPLVPSFTSHKAKKTNKKIDENDDNMKLLDKQSLSDYDHVENQKSRKSISGKMFGLKTVSGYQRFGDDESA